LGKIQGRAGQEEEREKQQSGKIKRQGEDFREWRDKGS